MIAFELEGFTRRLEPLFFDLVWTERLLFFRAEEDLAGLRDLDLCLMADRLAAEAGLMRPRDDEVFMVSGSLT